MKKYAARVALAVCCSLTFGACAEAGPSLAEPSFADAGIEEEAQELAVPADDGFDAWFPARDEARAIDSTTHSAPALATFDSKVWLVHTGAASNYLYARSLNSSGSLGPSRRFEGATSSSLAPSATAFNGSLYTFHRGADSNNIYYRRMSTAGVFSPADGDIQLSGSTSSDTPAVAAFNGRLFVVHKGNASTNLYYRSMSTSGTWTDSTRIPGASYSSTAVALTVFNSRLYVFHRGADSTQIYYRYLDTNGNWFPSSGDAAVPGSASSEPPAVAAHAGRLHLVHKGAESTRIFHRFMSAGGTWSENQELPGRFTTSAPALASDGTRLVMMHKGNESTWIWSSYLRHFSSNGALNDFWVRNPSERVTHAALRTPSFTSLTPFALRFSLPHPQGLARGPSNWYFSENEALTKCPGSIALSQLTQADCVQEGGLIPSLTGCNHLGDSEVIGSVVVAPLECRNSDTFVPNRMIAYDSAFNVVSHSAMSAFNYSAPWMAAYPLNTSLLFTSDFRTHGLHVYKDRDSGSGLSLQFLGEMPLYETDGGPIELLEVQGGDFSPAGHILLLAQDGTRGSGLYVFNSDTGRLLRFVSVKSNGKEFEGMNVHSGFAADGHVQLLDSDKYIFPLRLTDPTVFFP